MIKYLKLLRVKQHVKNLFLFLPLFFSANLLELNLLLKVALGALIFSLASSSIYILNDIKDVNEDRCHPQKCKRPIASGEVSISAAIFIAAGLLIISLGTAFILNKFFAVCILAYLIMNFLYSAKLKHIAIVDIIIISCGFVIRVIAGGILANIMPSQYLILLTFLISIFIALAKRYDDVLLDSKGLQTRKNIDGYNKEFILAAIAITAAINIVTYILYTLSDEIISQFNSQYVYLTSIFVITGFLRYLQLTFVENDSCSPTNILYKDKFILTTLALWIISFVIIIYV